MPHPVELLAEAGRGEPLALFVGAGWSRSILCRDPIASLTIPAGEEIGAFARLDAFLRKHRERTCAGWLGYDLGRDVESWPRTIVDDFEAPVLHVAAYARVDELPREEGPIARERKERTRESNMPAHDAIAREPHVRSREAIALPPSPRVAAASSFAAHQSRVDYERRVAAVVEHIRAGDIFQANLTQPFTAAWDGDPRALFWRMCEVSPAPFSAYVEDGCGTAALSSSPEEFLMRNGASVRTRPIKGTRRRGLDASEDARLLAELLGSDKDLAELAMIVDLLRNDLGKVAVTGSVEVGPFPEHATFAQVHHLFATVTARLAPSVSHTDLLRAAFPGGSITGCPKLRCLQILESLEVARRGVYTGAIGYARGDAMHWNVAIRTLVHKNGRIRANAGGGVTTLSDPAAEYDETLHKLLGIERTLQRRAEAPS